VYHPILLDLWHYEHAKGRQGEKNMTSRKKTVWVVRVNRGLEGWADVQTFSRLANADNWLRFFVKVNGYSICDFNIISRKITIEK
jgi:hypothetical protein